MSKQKTYSELKKRAMLAKKRMKMGYWQQIFKEKDDIIKADNANDTRQYLISEMQRAKYNRDNNMNCNKATEDEILYNKVKRILDSDEYTLNPIGQLLDMEVYNKMDEQNKQRYVLELSNKYREFRERYYKERVSMKGTL